MLCQCGNTTSVNATRALENGGVWRQRQCKACKTVFTTSEQPCETLPRDGLLRAMPRVVNPVHRQQKVPIKNFPRSHAAPLPANRIKPARMRVQDLKEQRQIDRDE
jgi:hypothetical protein